MIDRLIAENWRRVEKVMYFEDENGKQRDKRSPSPIDWNNNKDSEYDDCINYEG